MMIMKMRLPLQLMLSLSTVAFGADADFLRCRGIAEAASRLACYDGVVVAPADQRALPDRVVTMPDPRVSALPGTTPARSTTAALPPSTPNLADQFGMENRVAPGTLDSISSTIPGKFEGWDAKSNIKLANGQVWQISDDSSRYVTLIDPKVKIRRGALGSFYLEFEKINHSPRVKRVQ